MWVAAHHRTRIISGVPLSEVQINVIEAAGGTVLWHGTAGQAHGSPVELSQLPGLVAVMDKAEVWFGPGLSGALLARAPGLQWLQANSAGVETILVPDVVGSQLTVTNVRGMHSSTTGEHTLALMLALARGIAGSVLSQSRAVWSPTAISDIAPLANTRLLVLGTGMIGRAIAERASGFGMVVSGVSRSGRPVAEFASVYPTSHLIQVVADCDWFVVACPLTNHTRRLVSAAVIGVLPCSAIVINIARGAIIDEDALISALQSGRIRGAGLDVFGEEPLESESPLWKLPNVLITPHAGGAMLNYADRAVEYFARNLVLFRGGEALQSIVDKSAGY